MGTNASAATIVADELITEQQANYKIYF